jgi:hypothetical protein
MLQALRIIQKVEMKDLETGTGADGQWKRTAIAIVGNAQESEREALRVWLERLLQIQASDGNKWTKTRDAISVTRESKVVWRLLKLIGKEVRRHGWDKRSPRTRWAAIAAIGAVTVFGGQSAGIAALGGAIGVPLWVVFGGGAAFARILLDEIQRKKAANFAATTSGAVHKDAAIDGSYIDITPKD